VHIYLRRLSSPAEILTLLSLLIHQQPGAKS
jgi:hypothetical protein